jgi:LasA protease
MSRRIGRYGCLILVIAVSAVGMLGGTAMGRRADGHSQPVQIAVQRLMNRSAGRPAGARIIVSVTHRVGAWDFGLAEIPPPRRAEGAGIATSFLAQRRGHHWLVALQDTNAFIALLRRAPATLVQANILKLDQASTLPGGGAGGGPEFSLPWTPGQSWQLVQGPHNTNGSTYGHPFTSLDFSGGDGVLRAAADGVVYRPCANLVLIDHGGGWETGYYHMPSISVATGQFVHRGDVIGRIGTAVGCGGYAVGAHVHFSIYHFTTTVGTHGAGVWHLPAADIDGQVIGGYVVHDGSRGGQGCLQLISDGSEHCDGAAIANTGTIGGGGKQPVSQLGGYYTLAPVSVYSLASTSSSIVAQLSPDSPVGILCQLRNANIVGNSSIWDSVSGGWVPDYYVSTPTDNAFTPGLAQCNEAAEREKLEREKAERERREKEEREKEVKPTVYVHHVYGTCADGACGLKERAGPGYSAYAQTGFLAEGAETDIVCQTHGELVTPNHGTGSTVWDKLTNGAYITDVYVDTPGIGGAFSPPIPQC